MGSGHPAGLSRRPPLVTIDITSRLAHPVYGMYPKDIISQSSTPKALRAYYLIPVLCFHGIFIHCPGRLLHAVASIFGNTLILYLFLAIEQLRVNDCHSVFFQRAYKLLYMVRAPCHSGNIYWQA
jgi:hypothetical protein